MYSSRLYRSMNNEPFIVLCNGHPGLSFLRAFLFCVLLTPGRGHTSSWLSWWCQALTKECDGLGSVSDGERWDLSNTGQPGVAGHQCPGHQQNREDHITRRMETFHVIRMCHWLLQHTLWNEMFRTFYTYKENYFCLCNSDGAALALAERATIFRSWEL